MQLRERPWAVAVVLLCFWAPVSAAPDGPGGAPAPDASRPRALADLTLEDLLALEVRTVVSASKFVQDTTQAPASATVVTAEEIRLQGYRTLADVLRTVRGFYVSHDRNYSYVGVRGFSRPGDYNTRVLLLVDGHRVNDGLYGIALVGTELPVDLDLVERIEIIRGPGSALYGTGAIFAVVNVLTRRTTGPGETQVGFDVGTHGTVRVRATASGRTAGGVEGLFSATGYRSAGERTFSFGPGAAAPYDQPAIGLDDDRAGSVFARVTRGGLTAQLVHGSREKEIPTGAFETIYGAQGTETTDTRGYASLAYTGPIDTRTALDVRTALDWYDYSGRYRYDYGTPGASAPGTQVDLARVRSLSGEVSVARRVARHTITAGIESRWHPVLDQVAWDPTGSGVNERRRSHALGLFLQDEVPLGRRLLLNAGIGYDRYDSFATLTPRIAAIVSAVPGGTLKLLAGRAFRAPNAYELYYYEAPPGAAALRPETIWTGEVAWEHRVGRSLELSGGAFHSTVIDLVSQTDEPWHDELYFVNDGDVVARGIEAEARVYLAPAVHAQLSHAVMGMHESVSRRRLSNAPTHLTTFELIVPVPRTGLVAAANARRLSARLSPAGDTIAGAAITNLTVSRRQLGGRLHAGVSIHNLFDVSYVDPSAGEHAISYIPQHGRVVLGKVTLAF